MVPLGSARESTGFFETITEINSAEGRHVFSYRASLRVQELSDAGRSSLHPHPRFLKLRRNRALYPQRKEQINDWYLEARMIANQHQESRWAYPRKGLAKGRLPDIDPDFWKNQKEPKFPALPGVSLLDFTSPEGILM